ncbi:MAG TPA: Wzz/FepE/Etk N-terminal domain-containing protein [bacterium]|nr:Wzz/FepE/Etk N-terminal domain-containing protein [bacterium]
MKKEWLDYLAVLIKWRRVIIINFIIVAVLAAVLSLIVPMTFRSSTTLMPPTEDNTDIGLSSLLSNLPLGGLALGGMSDEANIFMAILKSRTVMESVARRFDLQKRYKSDDMEKTLLVLENYIDVKLNEEGTISLTTSAETPYFASRAEKDGARQLAQEQTRFFVNQLDSVNRGFKTEKARNSRIFIEKRYWQNLEDLKKAEEEFKQFQQAHGAISLPEQVTATIGAAAETKASITGKEIQIALMEKYLDPTHPDLLRARLELRELKKVYGDIDGSAGVVPGGRSGKEGDLYLPLQRVPDIGLQYARLYREVKIQEKLLEYILPQYEQAKVQEAKDTPTVQVLDPAPLPIKKSKPKRAIFVIMFALISVIFSSLFAFSMEHLAAMRSSDPERYGKLTEIATTLRSDLRHLFVRKRSH